MAIESVSTCPLHGTPLNADGDCLPCDIAAGKFDSRFEPGSPEAVENEVLKALATQRAYQAVEEGIRGLDPENNVDK